MFVALLRFVPRLLVVSKHGQSTVAGIRLPVERRVPCFLVSVAHVDGPQGTETAVDGVPSNEAVVSSASTSTANSIKAFIAGGVGGVAAVLVGEYFHSFGLLGSKC